MTPVSIANRGLHISAVWMMFIEGLKSKGQCFCVQVYCWWHSIASCYGSRAMTKFARAFEHFLYLRAHVNNNLCWGSIGGLCRSQIHLKFVDIFKIRKIFIGTLCSYVFRHTRRAWQKIIFILRHAVIGEFLQ